MAVTTEQQRIAEWRAQLAEEEGSDDDDAYGLAGKPPTFDDDDVGLGLEEPGLPQRPHEGPTAASRANRLNKSPPGRHSKGPAELHGLGGAGAERLVVGGRGGGDFVGRSPTKATNLQSGEETEALRRKVQVLHLQLEERDIELSQARALAGAAADATSGPVDARDAKLRELAKRAKAATMALGRERARAAQLAADLAAARKEASGGGGAAAAAGADGGALSIEAREAQVKELKDARDRLAASNAKLHEAKVGAAALKADLDRHRRALTREVGDEATAARLLHDDGGNSAKGRAEQISLLKDRLREATRRLEAAGADGDGGGGGGGYGGGGGAGSPSRESRVDESHRAALASLEAERRREMERVMLREQQLEGEVGELRRKETGAAARIRNLEADVKSKKEKLKQLLDKSDADDELVHALQMELQKLRKGGGRSGGGGGGGGGSPAGGRGGVEAAAEAHAQRRRLEELSTRAVQQQAQIDRQEHIILALRQQLQQQQQQRPQSGGANGGGYGGGGYGGGVKMPHDLIAVQTENGKLRELVALLQEKLVEAGA